MKFKFLGGIAAAVLWPALASASPNFTPEADVQISSGSPYAIVTASTSFRLYFTRDTFQILSATSTNGSTWSEESGVRIGTGTIPLLSTQTFTFTGAAVLPLIGGGYRMVYSIAGSTADWRIVSATSSDGLGWANETPSIFTSTSGFIGGPQLIKRQNGDWQVYFLRDSNGGNDLLDRQVFTSVSSNEGVSWTTPALALSNFATAISAVVRSDNRARLFLTQPLAQQTTSTVVLSALASDSQGISFNMESGTRLSIAANSGALSSMVVFHSTSNVAWRMLYAFQNLTSGFPNILAATTLDPDPQSLSPSQVVRTAPAGSFTIFGEVFDSTPTAKLTHSGETDIPGTSLVRNSDLSLTATFDTNNKTLGFWNVVVINSDGHAVTLANALLITFLSGNVVLTDNLLRPHTGARTKIEINIFDAGDVAVSVYTLDGQLVNSLYHAQTPAGALVLYWDGKTGERNVVASGVYFIKVTGPKLNDKQKVVVIR